MAKTLKDFLEGYLKVKSADEQKFVDKHVMAKNPDRNGNGDDVFKGSTKDIDRRKDRKGYNPGEDEKVYEDIEQVDEAGLVIPRRDNLTSLKKHSFGDSKLKGNQHKIDANKNGKVDAHDFKLLRAKKKVAEAIEELEELSTDTLNRYKTAARADASQAHQQIRTGPGRPNRRLLNRTAGGYAANRAIERQSKKTNEEAEQIDELSKKTLASYVPKAANRMAQSHAGVVKARHDYDSAAAIDHTTSSTPSNVRDAAKKIIRQDASKRENDNLKDVLKRHQGIERASKKLAKEEAQIDEKLNMDKASMGDVVKDFKDSNAPQFKGKSPAKRRVMAIAAKLTAERGGKPLNKEERLQNRLTDISESHQRVMLEVFDKLNEDNKSKFLGACSTPDGVDQMLDFAIRHRGE
jgi:hypothetical protein